MRVIWSNENLTDYYGCRPHQTLLPLKDCINSTVIFLPSFFQGFKLFSNFLAIFY